MYPNEIFHVWWEVTKWILEEDLWSGYYLVTKNPVASTMNKTRTAERKRLFERQRGSKTILQEEIILKQKKTFPKSIVAKINIMYYYMIKNQLSQTVKNHLYCLYKKNKPRNYFKNYCRRKNCLYLYLCCLFFCPKSLIFPSSLTLFCNFVNKKYYY